MEFEELLTSFEERVEYEHLKLASSRKLEKQEELALFGAKVLIHLLRDIHSIAESQRIIAKHARQQTYEK